MLKINPLSTLYIGIDVSSKSNYVCALDFYVAALESTSVYSIHIANYLSSCEELMEF